MIKLKHIIMMALVLCMGTSVSLTAQSEQATPEKESIVNEEREALRNQHKAEIEAIKADPSLTEEEKETQIREKRRSWAKKMRSAKRGEYKGGNRALQKEKMRRKKRAKMEGMKRELEAISKDPNLTPEQKEVAKAKLKEEKKTEQKEAWRKSYPKGEKPGKRKGRVEGMKKELDAINQDPNLTPEQKEAAKTKLKEEKRATLAERKEAWRKSYPKGEKPHGGKHKAKKGEGKRKMKAQKLNEKVDSGLSDEEKQKVVTRLDNLDKKLDKQKSKGKISVENYEKRKAEIAELRNKL